MKIPENIKIILENAAESFDKQIDCLYNEEERFDDCIHCNKTHRCELCRTGIETLLARRDALYEQMNEVTDFLRDNK